MAAYAKCVCDVEVAFCEVSDVKCIACPQNLLYACLHVRTGNTTYTHLPCMEI